MNQHDNEWYGDEDDDYVSKSELKREMEDRQALGEEIVKLPANQLDKIPLDEQLRDAIELAQRLSNKREAKRRQLQYIGRLMRSRDMDPIRAAVDVIKQRSLQANARFARLERLRDQLTSAGNDGVGLVLEHYPDADRQQLRQLLRKLHKADGTLDTATHRNLFRYLRELDEAALEAEALPEAPVESAEWGSNEWNDEAWQDDDSDDESSER